MNRVKTVLMACILVCGVTSTSLAGWALIEENGDETVISEGKMRSNWEQGAVIIDGNTTKVHFIDNNRKFTASGTVEEFCNGMTEMMDAVLESVPPEQREMMKKMMAGGEPPEIEIVKKGEGVKIGDFDTNHYAVMADGELYEELWIAADAALMKDCGPVMKTMGRFVACVAKMNAMGGQVSPESSPDYAKVFELGTVVKSVDKDAEKAKATTIEKRDVPKDAFTIPEDYKQVAFPVMFGMAAE